MSQSIVIIPTFNEAENVSDVIHQVLQQHADFHVLIVDDNSPDGTAQIVRNLQAHFSERLFLEVRETKSGLGTAYIHGFKWALQHTYQYVFEMDADLSHNPKDLIRLKAACDSGADMAIGSRYIKGVNVVNWPLGRVILSYLASIYVSVITGMRIKDATAGFICYKRHVLEQINLEKVKFVGYAFQIEMKFRAYKKKFNLVEVPIIFTDRRKGESKLSTGIISEAIFGVIKLKVKSIFGQL